MQGRTRRDGKFPAPRTVGVLIRMCTGPGYWICTDGGTPVEIGPRDIVMLPRGTPHTVSSTRNPGNGVVPFADLLKAHMIGRHGDHPIEPTYGADGAGRAGRTRAMVCGIL